MVNRSLIRFLCKTYWKCHPVTKLGYGTIYNAGKYEEVMVEFFTVIFLYNCKYASCLYCV